MSFVRESKFRHVFGDVWKTKYEEIQYTTKATESTGLRGNGKFVIVPWMGGGGPLAVIPAKKLGKVPRDQPKITGHTGAVLDFEFSPFDDTMLVSASEDSTIKAWRLPEEGLKENLRDAEASLEGHGKKVFFCTCNPTAAGVVASAAFDMTCKTWSLASQSEAFSVDVPDQMLSLRWNYSGSLLAGTCKDKRVHIIDPRNCGITASFIAHDSAKAAKLTWLGKPGACDDLNRLVTAGFSRSTSRQVATWDLRNPGKPLFMLDLDQGASPMYPQYDPGTGMLYLVGKGDSTVRYFELSSDATELYFLNQFASSTTQKAFDFIPKRDCDVSQHEVMRFLRLEDNIVHPITFKVPRKSEAFQDDLFPDCPSSVPALQADEWLGGAAPCEPLLQSMRPGGGASGGTKVAAAAPANQGAKAPAASGGMNNGAAAPVNEGAKASLRAALALPAAAGAGFAPGQRVRAMVKGAQLPGTVRYVGEIVDQAGSWVGVELDTADGKNDGEASGKRYFQCQPDHGVFVRSSQLALQQGPTLAPPSTAELEAARAVVKEGEPLTISVKGTARFVGGTRFGCGVWVGLEVDEGVGRCDGSVCGTSYFHCAPGRGLFLQLPGSGVVSGATGASAPAPAPAAEAAKGGTKAGPTDAEKVQKLECALREKRAHSTKQEAALEAAHKHIDRLEEQLVAAASREQELQRKLQANGAVGPSPGALAEPPLASPKGAPPDRAPAIPKAPMPVAPAPVVAKKPMTYKEQKEQERRELEEKLSAPSGFAGKGSQGLSAPEREVIEHKGTEAAGTGEYTAFAPQRGYFACKKCGQPIYSFEAKFKSGCGWPAFDKCYSNSIATRVEDDGTERIEITCARCGGHLGHIFKESASHDKKRSDQRHCANSRALQYVKDDPPSGVGPEIVLDLSSPSTPPPATAVPAIGEKSGTVAAAATDAGAAATDAGAGAGAPSAGAEAKPPQDLAAPAPLAGLAPRNAGGLAVDLSGLERLVGSLESSAERFAPGSAAQPATRPPPSPARASFRAAIDLEEFSAVVGRIEHAAQGLVKH